jgi:GntR family transcriptional regulator, galactonate operon transcriptional repressor
MSELIYYDLKETDSLAHSTAVQVSREIGRRIVSGNYRPGDLIEDELSISERFSVSRSVIRDAVKILVGKGLLEVRRGIGTRVQERTKWGLLDNDVLAWHLSAPPDRDFLSQLMDVQLIIEPKAARWACKHGRDKQLAEIDIIQTRMEEEQSSIDNFVISDALWHRAIFRATNNEIMRAMEGLIFSALLSSIRLTNKDPRKNKESIQFHRKIADAIIQRDADKAEEGMNNLLVDARHQLKNQIIAPKK